MRESENVRTSAAQDDAHLRMLAARDRVRRWFAPEAMDGAAAEVPEVIGTRETRPPRGFRRLRGLI